MGCWLIKEWFSSGCPFLSFTLFLLFLLLVSLPPFYMCLKYWDCLEFLFFFLNFLFIIYLLFLFLAVLGLRFCVRAFYSCGEWGPLFIAVHGPLTITASLVVEQRLQMLRLSSCGSWAQLLRGMWDLPRLGLEPMSPALAGRFSTTAPPGKPLNSFFNRAEGKYRKFYSTFMWIVQALYLKTKQCGKKIWILSETIMIWWCPHSKL